MSYILDALKKSEQQRTAGRIPTVAAPHGVLIEPARSGHSRFVVGIVVLVVAAGSAWWFFREGAGHRVETASTRDVKVARPETPGAETVVSEPMPAPVAPQLARQTAEVIPRLKLAVSLPARAVPTVPAPAESAPRSTDPVHSAPSAGRESSVAASSRAGVVPYSDLPPSVRQVLPALTIGGFATGDSGGTMVMVDDKLLREGDEASPGVRVEKILPDGAEFSYRGYRFRR